MKKLPFILIPIFAALVVTLLFIFVVPKDADLISAKGDYYLGEIIGYLFITCGVIDLVLLIDKKKNKK